MGGGYADGEVKLGKLPSNEEFGGGCDYNCDEVLRAGKGRSVQLAERGSKTWGPNWDEDESGGEFPNAHFFYLPPALRPLQPAALRRGLSGRRDVQPRRRPRPPRRVALPGATGLLPGLPVQGDLFQRDAQRQRALHRLLPAHRAGVAPACVRQCPGRGAFIGFLDDPTSLVHKFVEQWKVALPLHPEYGTEPNVYYVPPLAPAPLNIDRRPENVALREQRVNSRFCGASSS